VRQPTGISLARYTSRRESALFWMNLARLDQIAHQLREYVVGFLAS